MNASNELPVEGNAPPLPIFGKIGNPRTCVVCGDETQIEGGLFCENGHFVCAKPECKRVGFFSEIQRVICPICARLLR
jgi:hypothetical protein